MGWVSFRRGLRISLLSNCTTPGTLLHGRANLFLLDHQLLGPEVPDSPAGISHKDSITQDFDHLGSEGFNAVREQHSSRGPAACLVELHCTFRSQPDVSTDLNHRLRRSTLVESI